LLNLNRLLLHIHHLWQYQHNRTADPAILRFGLTAKEKKLLSDCSATLDSVEEMLLKGLSPQRNANTQKFDWGNIGGF